LILILFALQELEKGSAGWSVSSTDKLTVVAIGGAIEVNGDDVKVSGTERYVIRRDGKIEKAVWDGRELTRTRTVEIKGGLKGLALMPPIGAVELKGTDGEATLSMEVLDDPEAPADPAIDKNGDLRMRGPGIVVKLTGSVPKTEKFKFKGGAVDFTLTGIKSYEKIDVESSSGSITAESLEAPIVEFESSSGNIRLTSFKGKVLKIDAASGAVEVKDAEGTELKIEAMSGDVTLKSVKFEKRKIDTMSGRVIEE
jgi:hypothetical protein